jgi:ATP-dependent exoDNAse (exonuclease V) alpha subunit
MVSAGGRRLDAGQAAAVAVLAGLRELGVVEGAAGAGKTTTLSATSALLDQQGRRLVVVTPTLKAAKVAAAEICAAAGSVSWLLFQHGWRWDADGAWTRLTPGDIDPVTGRPYTGPTGGAQFRPGDLLVVDEAGMLDQDTARALLTVADECRVRVAHPRPCHPKRSCAGSGQPARGGGAGAAGGLRPRARGAGLRLHRARRAG